MVARSSQWLQLARYYHGDRINDQPSEWPRVNEAEAAITTNVVSRALFLRSA